MIGRLGASHLGNGTYSFLVWAPARKQVALRLLAPREETLAMAPREGGYFEAVVEGLEAEPDYLYLLDGELARPDPASRFQPRGLHLPSRAVRHEDFPWEDEDWLNPPFSDYIIYELHVGTFTPEGTFEAIIPRLGYLREELGVTALEIMPVAQFPGGRNWGYDGAQPFAVQSTYGGPAGLKKLVAACHRAGLAVVLDVVYNHLGPEGNYLCDFGPYFTPRYRTPWGMAVNFDGPGSDGVRRFVIDNALSWINDFHIDALRLDAVHGIFDCSARHILSELHDEVAARAARRAYLIAESDLNDARLVRPPALGGFGLTAQWLDDCHHALHTLLTGERQGYYQDFGTVADLAAALTKGFVYDGRYSRYRRRRFGSSSRELPASRFVVFSQNHDQVGNRAQGDRPAQRLNLGQLKIAAALVLLSPYVPLLFMGEEYGETAPFQYFVSHEDQELAEAVRRGRREEFAAFVWEGEVPDPQAESTFARSRPDPELRHEGWHRELLAFYRRLIRLRTTHPVLRTLDRSGIEAVADDERRTLTLRRRQWGRQLFYTVNFSDRPQPAAAGLPGAWRLLVGSPAGPGPTAAELRNLEGTLELPPHSFFLYELVP
ncbi:MAG: malto-oligosyltrehalose trehalohydrolase [Desulfobacteraceae bacterium]|nr:malto-oligosyltrehalose trehalohydrolase [Desulfobacteraceae bacterium]